MSTKAAFFIIESRKIKEEKKSKKQGLILTEVLKLIGLKTEYRYIRTYKEFNEMIKQYYASNFRYLHIATHGTTGGFSLTLEQIKYEKFCKAIIKMPNSNDEKRRLFISACNVKKDIAKIFLKKQNTFMSIIAPSINIKTRIAPIAWATFYNKVFEIEANKLKKPKKINNDEIREHLHNICKFYDIKFNGYFRRKKTKKGYDSYDFPEVS